MKDIAKMRLGVLRELKNVHKFFDNVERSVKNRNPDAIQKAYILLIHLVREMDSGFLSPDNIALDLELALVLREVDEVILTPDNIALDVQIAQALQDEEDNCELVQ